MTPGKKQEHASNRSPLWLLAPLPALALGVWVMRASGVPAAAWGQNVGAWAAGMLLCFGIWRRRSSAPRGRWADLVAMLTLAALAATLLAPGMQGVHRWVKLGPVRLHAASILLPLLLVALEHLRRTRGWWIATLVAAGVTSILFVQPDAAQATAFAIASGVVLLPRAEDGAPRLVGILSLPVLAGITWLRRDPLGRVPHVEDIVGMAADVGTGWAVAAVVSLLLLPVPFFLARRRVGTALGTYVAISLLAPLVGNFPVPVLGYGASPILGYLVGMGVFLRPHAHLPDPRPGAPVGAGAMDSPPG